MVVLYDRIQPVNAGYLSNFYPNYSEKQLHDQSNLRIKIFEENNQYFIKLYGKSSISKQTETYLIENVELEDKFVHELKFKKYNKLYISFDLLSDNDICSVDLMLIFDDIVIDQTFKFNEFYKFKQYLEAVFNKKFGVEAEIHKNLTEKFEKSEKEILERIKEAVNKEFGVEAEIHKKLKKKFEKSKKETSVVLYDRIQQVYAGYFSDFYPNYYEKRHQDRSNLRVKIFEENNQYFIKIYGKSSISKQTETYLIENVELEDEFVHRLKFKKYDELYISFDLLSDNDTCSVDLKLISDNKIMKQTYNSSDFYKFKQYLEAVFNKKFGVEAEIYKNLKNKLEKSEKETSEKIKEAVNNKKFDVETEMYKNLKKKFEKSEKETSEKIKKLEKEIEELKISMKNNKSTVNNVQINQFFFKTDDF